MVLGLGKGDDARDTDVASLIARKQYGRAVEVLKAQLASGKPDDRVRLQLADLLERAGKAQEAVAILISLADGYARDGFAAKAISMLKRIERIDPGRKDVGRKLASVIEEKQRQANISAPAPTPSLEIGMEEIGFDSDTLSVSVPADDQPPEPMPEIEGPPPGTDGSFQMEEDPGFALESPAADPVPQASPVPRHIPAPLLEPVVDRDLVSEDDLPEITVDPEPEIESEAEVESLAETTEPEMSEAAFGDELLALVDEAFGGQESSRVAPEGRSDGQQIVVSPLFKDFSVDELVAVIQGLTLLSFEAGQTVITEGEDGDSLYMVTSGSVRVIRKTQGGRRSVVGSLKEGDFFGEGSILTGHPRTASVVAASRCEMLELDRPTLDGIVANHPRVWQILEEFATERRKGRPPTS